MDRAERLFTFIDKAARFLASEKSANPEHPLYDLLHGNLDLLDLFRSLPEYSEHCAAAFHNDFAFLPNEVINDVVVIGEEKRVPETHISVGYRHLLKVAGSWGEYAKTSFVEASFIGRTLNFVLKRYNGSEVEEQKLLFKEAKTKLISHTVLEKRFNWKQLARVAANLHGSIEILDTVGLSEDILDQLGSCFSRIEYSDENTKDIPTNLIQFLLRQLRSEYLRDLCLYSYHMDMVDALEDSLVKFVSKPFFENLQLYCAPDFDCEYSFPIPILESALRTWEARDHFDVDHQQISGYTTLHWEEFLKLAQIDAKTVISQCPTHPKEFEVIARHPKIPNAKVLFWMNKNGTFWIIFCNSTDDYCKHDPKVDCC